MARKNKSNAPVTDLEVAVGDLEATRRPEDGHLTTAGEESPAVVPPATDVVALGDMDQAKLAVAFDQGLPGDDKPFYSGQQVSTRVVERDGRRLLVQRVITFHGVEYSGMYVRAAELISPRSLEEVFLGAKAASPTLSAVLDSLAADGQYESERLSVAVPAQGMVMINVPAGTLVATRRGSGWDLMYSEYPRESLSAGAPVPVGNGKPSRWTIKRLQGDDAAAIRAGVMGEYDAWCDLDRGHVGVLKTSLPGIRYVRTKATNATVVANGDVFEDLQQRLQPRYHAAIVFTNAILIVRRDQGGLVVVESIGAGRGATIKSDNGMTQVKGVIA